MSRLSDLDLLREIIPQVEKTTTPKSKKDECRTRSVKSTELIQKEEEDSKHESEITKELRERVTKLKEIEEFDKIKTGASLGLTAYLKPKLGIPVKDLSLDLQSFIELTKATLKQSKHFGKVVYDHLTNRINFYTHDDTNLENILGFIDVTRLPLKLHVDKILDITSDNAIANSVVAKAIQNVGTITGITMNNTNMGTSGVVNLGTVLTEHQDISGKANSADLATVATSGSYNDLTNKPTIPAAQVLSDWTATSGMGVILHKPNLATVATSGSYNDLTNKPTIPAAYDDSTLSGRVTALENAGYITTETDPSVPSWAKQSSKPSYTASEVGAVPTTRKVNGKDLTSDVNTIVYGLKSSTGFRVGTYNSTTNTWTYAYSDTTLSVQTIYFDNSTSKAYTYNGKELKEFYSPNLSNFANINGDAGEDFYTKVLKVNDPNSMEIVNISAEYDTNSEIVSLRLIDSVRGESRVLPFNSTQNTSATIMTDSDFKTINNLSIIGSGNITINSGSPEAVVDVSANNANGNLIFTKANGNTITADLNHTHSLYLTAHQSLTGYAKYVLCQDEAEFISLANKDSSTLYLIPAT